MRVLLPGLLVVAAVAGCPKDTAVGSVDNGADVVKAAIEAQNVRVGAVRDYAVEGAVVDKGSGQSMKFRYAMQQPSYSVGELLDGNGDVARAFVFDGKVLAVVDAATKSVTHQDFSKNEEQMLLTLHEIFSQFVCEGWRPPLIKPQGTTGASVDGAVVLTIPVDDPAVSAQRLTLKSDGAFAKKELLDKGGNVLTSTTVLDEVKDPATGLLFPKKWSHSENGSTQEVELSAFKVNAGVDPARFNTNAVPTGYQSDRSAP